MRCNHMKKHPLDIAILICLIIIIILLVILLCPEEKTSTNKKQENEVEVKEEKTESKTTPSKSLLQETTPATNEQEVISYIEEVNRKVDNMSTDDKTVKETLEDTFITLTDFIFYGGEIKGVTFNELTDSAKEKVLTLYNTMDQKIESKFPNYKENIATTAKKSYTTAVEKANELKENILSKYKEQVGENAYNNVVESFQEDKDNLKESATPYIEKGKELTDSAITKGKEVVDNTKEKLDSWYQEFKESR